MPKDLAAGAGPLVARARRVARLVDAAVETARTGLVAELGEGGRISAATFEAEQARTHALAWVTTYARALDALAHWAETLDATGGFGEIERGLLTVGFGEYLQQITGGLPMSQGEIARPADIGLDAAAILAEPEVAALIDASRSPDLRRSLATELAQNSADIFGADGLDEDMGMIRDQFRRFVRDRVAPHAHGWHLRDELIPMEIIEEMSEMGVFGLTVPEAFGGLGMPKTAMCVVSEELSRGYIGVGSLGTRSEIACELVLSGGTQAQKESWLPRLASGEVLPTAVFTEPNTGSDLGSLRTRATRDGDDWRITGQKTWITHAARASVMTVLARTEEGTTDWRGLSMFLAEKTPGTDDTPFPDAGLSGTEIEVLGYRGMKEYELSFDGFAVKGENLLGGATGQGFKALMQTFESARIQTAARAIGVGQAALDASLAYAQTRQQFGKPLIAFPRVSDKLVMMAVELTIARQLTYAAAAAKDEGRRCDLEAGMAKLLAARVAWAAADNGVQIHGGNGFAMEYEISRILCDARILSIFEGAAEIQAQVIARRLLSD